MTLNDDISLLERVRMLQGFDTEHLRLLAFGAEKRRVRKDELLFQAGQMAAGGYAVTDGCFELRRPGGDGNRKPNDPAAKRQFGPGSLLAELALISDVDHVADAVALEDSQVLKIPRSLFRRMLQEYPALADLLQGKLLDETQDLVGKLDRLRTRLEYADTLDGDAKSDA